MLRFRYKIIIEQFYEKESFLFKGRSLKLKIFSKLIVKKHKMSKYDRQSKIEQLENPPVYANNIIHYYRLVYAFVKFKNEYKKVIRCSSYTKFNHFFYLMCVSMCVIAAYTSLVEICKNLLIEESEGLTVNRNIAEEKSGRERRKLK